MKSKTNNNGVLIKTLNRRDLIKLGLIATGLCLIPGKGIASLEELLPEEFRVDERKLCVYNLHTKENIEAVYWKDGNYIQEVLEDFNYIFRDHYTGSVRRIDRHLLDVLFAIQQKLQFHEPFHLISGYRTVRTNMLLRKENKYAAIKSYHIFGKAADIRVPGVSLKVLRRAAYELKAGGVGYYPKDRFMHIDTGKVRFWNKY
jgi:uncharacterized protein YcbK (DUF882 family)